jgi:hypothetical protein
MVAMGSVDSIADVDCFRLLRSTRVAVFVMVANKKSEGVNCEGRRRIGADLFIRTGRTKDASSAVRDLLDSFPPTQQRHDVVIIFLLFLKMTHSQKSEVAVRDIKDGLSIVAFLIDTNHTTVHAIKIVSCFCLFLEISVPKSLLPIHS